MARPPMAGRDRLDYLRSSLLGPDASRTQPSKEIEQGDRPTLGPVESTRLLQLVSGGRRSLGSELGSESPELDRCHDRPSSRSSVGRFLLQRRTLYLRSAPLCHRRDDVSSSWRRSVFLDGPTRRRSDSGSCQMGHSSGSVHRQRRSQQGLSNRRKAALSYETDRPRLYETRSSRCRSLLGLRDDARRSIRARSKGLGLRCRLRLCRLCNRENRSRQSSTSSLRDSRSTVNRGLILYEHASFQVSAVYSKLLC